MRTTLLIAAATAFAFLGVGALAANGPKDPATGPAAAPAPAAVQDQTPGVCPNGCTPGSGYCAGNCRGRGYCGGRNANAQAGPKGPMARRGMRTGPQDGTGPRRDGTCQMN